MRLKALLPIISTTLLAPLCAELKVEVYGYIKLDTQYNDRNTGQGPSPSPTQVPLNTDTADKHGELILDARESRVGVRATEKFNSVEVFSEIEGDFFTYSGNSLVSNGRGFRLRMAYMQAIIPSGFFFQAGQNWSLFMNANIAQPNLIDFNGPVGSLSNRQPQLRGGWVNKISDTIGEVKFQASIEQQSIPTIGETNSATGVNTAQGTGQRLPLTVAKMSLMQQYFQIEVAGCAAQSVVVTSEKGHQLKKWVWGVQSSAQLMYKKFTLLGSGHGLYGLSRMDGGNYTNDLIFTFSGNLERIKSYGWYAGGAWAFTQNLSINSVYGWEKANEIPDSTFSGTNLQKFHSFHANILYQFWSRWQTAFEFERFWIKSFNGIPGHVDIYHTALYYFF